MRFLCAILLSVIFHASFLQATEPLFKFTFGSNLGNIPLEINKMSKNIKTIGGIKINSWTLSPNFSSFSNDKKILNQIEKTSKESLYLKIKFKF
jgi:hypothetical protein|tara:strand:+ start:716 stop:997 length:282 start_codon:yes stop_codon:yes gene_type:complete